MKMSVRIYRIVLAEMGIRRCVTNCLVLAWINQGNLTNQIGLHLKSNYLLTLHQFFTLIQKESSTLPIWC